MLVFLRGFWSFLCTVLIIALLGPIPNTSSYSSINSDVRSTNFPPSSLIISIIIGTVDSFMYGLALYVAIQGLNKSHIERMRSHEEVFQYYHSIFMNEKDFLNPMRETLELFVRTQTDLHNLIREVAENDTSDRTLVQSARNKLETLEFIQAESATAMLKNIDRALHLFNTNKTREQSFHNLRVTSNILVGVDGYIFTASLLLCTYQIARWILQYLTFRNSSKYRLCLLTLSTVIVSHSLGFIYFLHILTLVHYLFLFYICTWILVLRSFASICYYAFSDDGLQ